MDFLSARMKKVAVVERWPLVGGSTVIILFEKLLLAHMILNVSVLMRFN